MRRPRESRAPLTPRDLLAREGEALRSLAVALTRDEHEADDLVQDAWVAALRRPAAPVARPTAWLRTVVRNLAANRGRSEERRRTREALAAEGHAASEPPEADLVHEEDRVQTLLVVTRAVAELDEPFRATVLARWFEGLPPRAIAARSGVRVATVKSRLSRAHALLRDRLARELGGERSAPDRWRERLGALVGLPLTAPHLVPDGGGTASPASEPAPTPPVKSTANPSAASAGASTGGAVTLASLATMSLKTPLVSAALLVVAVGATAWQFSSGDPASPTPARAAATPSRTADLVEPALEDASASARETVTSELAAAEAAALREHVVQLNGFVRDGDDLPVAGKWIYVAPRAGVLNQAVRTDARGRFELSIASRRRSLDVLVAVQGDSRSGFLDLMALTLTAGSPTHVDLSTGVSEGDASAYSLTFDAVVGSDEGGGSRASYFRVVNIATPDPLLANAQAMVFDAEGVGRFHGSTSAALCPGSTPVQTWSAPGAVTLGAVNSLRLVDSAVASSEYELPLVHWDAGLQVIQGDEQAPTATIRGKVQDLAGRPVADASVAALSIPADGEDRTLGAVRARTRTDAEGNYELTGVPVGACELIAGGGGHGVARFVTEVAEADELVWEPSLVRGRELVGTLVDEDGAPLAEWSVEIVVREARHLFTKRTQTDEAGRFAFANLPNDRLALFARKASSRGLHRPLAEGIGANGDLGDLIVPETEAEGATVSLEVVAVDGDESSRSQARLESLAHGRALHLRFVPEEGRHVARDVPAGTYRLVVLSPVGSEVVVEPLRIDAFGTADLGVVELPAPASLALADARPEELREASPEGEEEAWTIWRETPTHRARVWTPTPGETDGLPVPAGTYLAEHGQAAVRAELERLDRGQVTLDAKGALSFEHRGRREAGWTSGLDQARCQGCHAGASEDLSGSELFDVQRVLPSPTVFERAR